MMVWQTTGAAVDADKGYNSADDEACLDGETGVRLVLRWRTKITPNTLGEWFGLRTCRGGWRGQAASKRHGECGGCRRVRTLDHLGAGVALCPHMH
jgi:hypothetical protein